LIRQIIGMWQSIQCKWVCDGAKSKGLKCGAIGNGAYENQLYCGLSKAV
jgi:hypothetical protein